MMGWLSDGALVVFIVLPVLVGRTGVVDVQLAAITRTATKTANLENIKRRDLVPG